MVLISHVHLIRVVLRLNHLRPSRLPGPMLQWFAASGEDHPPKQSHPSIDRGDCIGGRPHPGSPRTVNISAAGTISTTPLDQAEFDHRRQRTLGEGVVASLGELSPGTAAFQNGITDLLKYIPLLSVYEAEISKGMSSRGSFPAPPISRQLEAPYDVEGILPCSTHQWTARSPSSILSMFL